MPDDSVPVVIVEATADEKNDEIVKPAEHHWGGYGGGWGGGYGGGWGRGYGGGWGGWGGGKYNILEIDHWIARSKYYFRNKNQNHLQATVDMATDGAVDMVATGNSLENFLGDNDFCIE